MSSASSSKKMKQKYALKYSSRLVKRDSKERGVSDMENKKTWRRSGSFSLRVDGDEDRGVYSYTLERKGRAITTTQFGLRHTWANEKKKGKQHSRNQHFPVQNIVDFFLSLFQLSFTKKKKK